MKRTAMAMLAVMAAGVCGGQTVNPRDNPLLGNWVYSSGGIGKYGCARTRTFAAKSLTFEFQGKVLTRDVLAYAVEPGKVYVQEHLGSGGTVAYVVVNKNEIMDTLGTGACHWKRQ